MDDCNRHQESRILTRKVEQDIKDLNMGLINKVDMVCLPPVGYGV